MADPSFKYLPKTFGETNPTKGSLLYWNGDGWVALAPGADGTVITSTGDDIPAFEVPVAGNLVISGQTAGDIIYFNGTSWVRLAAGSAGQALLAGATPSYGFPAGLAIASQASGDILYFNGTAWVRLAAGTAGTGLQAGTPPAWVRGAPLGVGDNSNAAAGFIGEYIESVIPTASAVGAAFVATEFGNITSVSLTAGDWDVTGMVHVQAGTYSLIQTAVSVNTGNTTTDHVIGSNATSIVTAAPVDPVVANYRLSLNATTTVYLKVALTGVPADILNGRLSARRVR